MAEDVVFRIQAQDSGFPELEARVSKALTSLAKNFTALGDSQQAAAAKARTFESQMTALTRSQAEASVAKVNASIAALRGTNPQGGVGSQTYGPATVAPPKPSAFDAGITRQLEALKTNFMAVGKSEAEATAEAERFRGGIAKLAEASASARITQLQTEIANVGKEAGLVGRIFEKIPEQIKGIGKIAIGVATGNIGAQLGMGLEERIATAAEQIDKFGSAVWHVQTITGETAEHASELVAVFQRFGLSGDDAASKLSRLERALTGTDTALDLTETGGKRGQQILRDIGVTFQDATGKVLPLSAVLLNLAGQWSHLDAESRNAAARGLFGGLGGAGAEQMNLMLSQGREGFEALMEAARKYGLVLTQENVDDVKQFTFAHRDMDLALQGVAIQFGAGFMPAVTAGARLTAGFAQMLNQAVMPALKAIPTVLPLLTIGMGTLLVAAAARATFEMGKFAVTGLIQTGQAIVKLSAPLAGLIARYAATAAAATAAAVAQVAAWLAAAGPVVLIIGGIALAVGALALALSGKLGEAKDAIGNAIGKIAQAVKDGWDAVAKLTAPSDAGEKAGEAYGEASAAAVASKAEKAAKAAKTAADGALKQIQDAAAQRKDAFDLDEIDKDTGVLKAKLDELVANQALVGSKRQIEDIDANSVDFALKRRQLDEEDAVAQAKIAENKLRSHEDDLSYQEKLLLAQARAAKMRGETVDMAALRDKVKSIREQQIQDAPGLLVAEHKTVVADRAKQATDLTDTLRKDAIERQKLAIQEAMKPFQDAANAAKRAYEDAQAVVELDKVRFDIAEQAHKAELITAQAAAKAADEAYQAAVAAKEAADEARTGAPATAHPDHPTHEGQGVSTPSPDHPTHEGQGIPALEPKPTGPTFAPGGFPVPGLASGGPVDAGRLYVVGENGPELFAPQSSGTILPSGIGGGGGQSSGDISLQITNHIGSVNSPADEDRLITRMIDRTLETLRAAMRQVNQPARSSLPGAYAGGTP